MTSSTLITASELQDLSTVELQSKFFSVSRDIDRMRQSCTMLPLAEASLQTIGSELARRRIRGRKP